MPYQGSILTKATRLEKRSTSKYTQWSKVILVTKEGWLEEKHQCPKENAEFWNHRCELSALDGLVFKGEKLVVPRVTEAGDAEENPHSHLGIEKCIKRSRGVLFCPEWMRRYKSWLQLIQLSAWFVWRVLQRPRKNRSSTKEIQVDLGKQSPRTCLFWMAKITSWLLIIIYSRYPETEKLENTLRSTTIIYSEIENYIC